MTGARPEPIAALATVVGESETALVRISGPGCHAILAQIFVAGGSSSGGAVPPGPASTKKGAAPSIERGALTLFPGDRPLLPAIVVRYREGHSYTGEESVEILLPGAPIWARALLATLEGIGVGPAGPGEFTRRAFENGRIDLTRAESVAALIAAESATAERAARLTLEGVLADAVRAVADRIHDTIALLEAGLDFADQEVEPPSPHLVRETLAGIESELLTWLLRPDAGGRVGENARCLLWGRTNAGKSSLLNALCAEDRALVSAREGTTTDAVSGRLETPLGAVELLDLPGLKGQHSAIEARADDLARRSVAEEDPILYLFDAGRPSAELAVEWAELPSDLRGRSTRVLQKIDRVSPTARADWSRRWPDALQCSALTGEGLDSVRDRIALLRQSGAFVPSGSSLHFNDRQRRRIEECRATLLTLADDLKTAGRTEPELVVVDLRRAHGSLEEITGEIVTEETLTRIFSRFCVGK